MAELSPTVYEAGSESDCALCPAEIERGEEYGTVDGEVVCFGCWVGAGGDEFGRDETDDEDD